MLDIVVTHYNEPWNVGKPFFDMLGCQRGVSFDDFRVILVHDGVKPFPQGRFTGYPYRVEQHRIPHGGVSAARNYGLSVATDRWIEFCDFDDMYSNAYALRSVMSVMDNDVDYLWTPFFCECKTASGDIGVREYGENIIWVHGKYFRREWLIGKGLQFPEGIHYSEDSAFGALVNELAENGRRGKIKAQFPAYIWVYREDSVSMNPANRERNMTGFIDRDVWVIEEYRRRGIPHILMVGRMFADAYWAFHQVRHRFPRQEERFAGIAERYMDELAQVSPEDMAQVMKAASATFRGTETDTAEPFSEWLERIRTR